MLKLYLKEVNLVNKYAFYNIYFWSYFINFYKAELSILDAQETATFFYKFSQYIHKREAVLKDISLMFLFL